MQFFLLLSLVSALLSSPSLQNILKGVDFGTPENVLTQIGVVKDNSLAFGTTSPESELSAARRLDEDDDGGAATQNLAMLRVLRFLPLAGIAGPIVWVIFAVLYKSKVNDQRAAFQGGGGGAGGSWKYGTCDCFSDCQMCLHGCFFPYIRAGDTYAGAGIIGFWVFVGVGVGKDLLINVIHVVFPMIVASDDPQDPTGNIPSVIQLVLSIAFCAWAATLRGKLANALGVQGENCAMGYCCWFWCMTCTICQEGRQFDEATGVMVSCCCNMESKAPPGGNVVVGQVVGQAVGVSSK